ncbi:MAG: hypothetical protein VKJ04_01885 [Vampirovibrionales bacterium]|nr:hypothetical protein [Vampirovibrionales bacterium]
MPGEMDGVLREQNGLPSSWPSSSLNSTQFNQGAANPFGVAGPAPSVLPMSAPMSTPRGEFASSIGPSGFGASSTGTYQSGQVNFAGPYQTSGDGFSSSGGLSFGDNYPGYGALPSSTQNVLAMTNNGLAQATAITQQAEQSIAQGQQAQDSPQTGQETENNDGGGIGSNLGASDSSSSSSSSDESGGATGTSENPEASEEAPEDPNAETRDVVGTGSPEEKSKRFADYIEDHGVRTLKPEDLEHIDFREIMGRYPQKARQILANMDLSELNQNERDRFFLGFSSAVTNGFANAIGVDGSDLNDEDYSASDFTRIKEVAAQIWVPESGVATELASRLDVFNGDVWSGDDNRIALAQSVGEDVVSGWSTYLKRDTLGKVVDKLRNERNQTLETLVDDPEAAAESSPSA